MNELELFVDFWQTTREHLATSPDALSSQASRYRTHLWRRMLRGLTEDMIVQSGTKIIDFIQLDYESTFSHFDATDDFEYEGTNSLTQIEVPWRFSKVHEVVWEHELHLQQGDQRTVFKRIKKAKQSNLELSWFEGNEDALWAAPNYETMEQPTKSGVGQPLSLLCFITDDGLYPSSTNSNLATDSSDWTTLLTVDSTKTNWRNQVAHFDNTSTTTRRADDGGLVSAMDEMWLKCQYESPSNSEEYVKSTRMQKMRIVSNLPSQKLLVSVATGKNNVLSPHHDIGWAAGRVVYHGIPTDYIGKLDTVDDQDAADVGDTEKYRWRYINFNHIKPIFHRQHYRRMRDLDGGASQPNAKVMLEDTWHNLWLSNRREQGIVRPSTAAELA